MPGGALTERVALVTAAGSGICRASAQRLVALGARVAAVDIDQVKLAALVTELGEDRVESIVASVLSDADVERAVEATVARWGRIDVLVNGVGGGWGPGFSPRQMPMADMTMDYWLAALDFNLNSAVRCIRTVLPLMRARGSGRIINFSSLAAYGTYQGSSAAYAAAKAAIIALTKRLALELGPDGITVNAIAPGHTATERVRTIVLAEMTPDARAALTAQIPLRRFGEPEEIAHIVAFLASDLASYINGAVIDANAGAFV